MSILLLAVLPATSTHAQAPIERQPPPAPAAPGPPIQWQIFESQSRNLRGFDITVRATPYTARCILDEVRPDFLLCHREFRPLPFLPVVLPDRDYQLSRTNVIEVWRPDRAASALLGIGIGFGLAAGANASQPASYRASDIVLVGSLLGAIGGYIGYRLPLIHHVIYRAR
jgi:hypothetical protein